MPSTTIEISREQRQPLHRLVTQHISGIGCLAQTRVCLDAEVMRSELAHFREQASGGLV